jgi:hypothetical protein
MKSRKPVIVLATTIVLASAFLWRHAEGRIAQYQTLVDKTAAVTEGYDQNFIAMVDRLEEELANRASFPYLGKKDPMTGKIRNVVIPVAPPRERSARRERTVPAVKNNPQTAPVVSAAVPVIEAPDPVRLTAVIYDDIKRVHTAIMMVGERSFSVEVGDRIYGRRTTGITVSSVTLEDQNKIYEYNISGQSSSRAK